MSIQRPLKKPAAASAAAKLINEITPALHYDLGKDVSDVIEDIKLSVVGEPPLGEFNDHLRSAIRSLFGQIEAVTHCLASAIIACNPAEIQITNADRAVLEELDYDAETDTLSSNRRRYSLAVRFEVSSRLFLEVCGAPPAAPWDADATNHFQLLTRARNQFTHPKRLEELIVSPSFESFRHVALWFPSRVIQVLGAAAQSIGLPPPQPLSPFPITPLPVPMPRPEEVFDESFYAQVFSDPATAIRYIGFFSQQLDDELRRAFDHCNPALSRPYRPLVVGRAIRRMVRAVTTNAEGTIGFTTFFMRAVRFGKAKIAIPPAVKGESVPERLIHVLTAFSAAFGNDVTPTADASWDSLVATFKIRDRLTHPRQKQDVELTLDDLTAAMKALDWLFGPAHEAILLDQDKIAGCFGSRNSPPNQRLQRMAKAAR